MDGELMKLIIDTNVVIDNFAIRKPYDEVSRLLFLLGSLSEFELWVGASQVTDIFYLLSTGTGKMGGQQTLEALRNMRKHVQICSLDALDIDAALDSAWEDFEDACFYQCALKIKADAIVTRNQEDFARSSIKVFDCAELFDYLENEKGLVYEEIEW